MPNSLEKSSLQEKSSLEWAEMVPCPVCWVMPECSCNFDDGFGRSMQYPAPPYHWRRLERAERRVPTLPRHAYLHEIKNLRHIELMSILIRRAYFEYPLNYQYFQFAKEHSVTRDQLITLLLPTGGSVMRRGLRLVTGRYDRHG